MRCHWHFPVFGIGGRLRGLGPNPLTEAQARITGLVETQKELLVNHALKDLGEWQTSLRSLANHLEDLEIRAKRAAQLDVAPERQRTRARSSSDE